MKILAERLVLIAATVELLSAEMENFAVFHEKVGAEVPASWPPDLYDRPAQEWMHGYLLKNPDAAGWGLWYILLRGQPETLIGTCGYKGKPSADGAVEIGYSILPEFQRKGYAAEAAGALVDRAFAHPEINRVTAETFPEHLPSIRVLEKNGFVMAGAGSEPGVLRFELTRTAYKGASRKLQKENK